LSQVRQSEEAKQRLTEVLTRFYRDEVGLPHWREVVARSHARSPGAKFKRLERYLTFRGKKVLDVGCGYGDLTDYLMRQGATLVAGVEPNLEAVQVAHGLISDVERSLLCNAVGEHLPFNDAAFDLIVSNTVLEHVQSPRMVISEMARVLKPGGLCWISVPNYLFPMEPHWQLMWIPYLPRRVAEKYAAWRGRNPDFLKTVTYITPFKLKKWLRESGMTIKADLIQDAVSDPTLILSERWRLVARLLRLAPHFLVQLLSPMISVIVEKV